MLVEPKLTIASKGQKNGLLTIPSKDLFFSFSVGFEKIMQARSPNLRAYFPEPDLQNLCFRTVFHPICYEYVDIPQCDGPCEEKIAFCLDKTRFFWDFRKMTKRPVGKMMKTH